MIARNGPEGGDPERVSPIGSADDSSPRASESSRSDERASREGASEPGSPGSRNRTARRLLGCLAFGAGALLVAAVYQLVTWPDVERLATERPESTAFLDRARAGSEAEIPDPTWIAYEGISPHLKRAVLVSEDIDFFSHQGFAWDEMRSAWREFRRGEGLRGASTLTQQLAKNLWLSPSRNPWRKAKEALLTVQLERHLSKRRILEIYFNVIELGPGVFGVENASRHYFGKSAAHLSETEAAALAAAIPSPHRWQPGSGSRAAGERQRTILRRMARAGWLWKVI